MGDFSHPYFCLLVGSYQKIHYFTPKFLSSRRKCLQSSLFTSEKPTLPTHYNIDPKACTGGIPGPLDGAVTDPGLGNLFAWALSAAASRRTDRQRTGHQLLWL